MHRRRGRSLPTVGGMTETGWIDALSRLGPVATGVAALVALAVGIATVRQRDRADQRDQWWKRAQWALELTLSPHDELARRGFAVLGHLARSDLAAEDEKQLLHAFGELGLIRRLGLRHDDEGPTGGRDDARERCPVDRFEQETEEQLRRRVTIPPQPSMPQVIARFLMEVDEELGRTTPQWIREVAEERPEAPTR